MDDRTYEQQTAPAPKIEIVTPIERRRRWRAVDQLASAPSATTIRKLIPSSAIMAPVSVSILNVNRK